MKRAVEAVLQSISNLLEHSLYSRASYSFADIARVRRILEQENPGLFDRIDEWINNFPRQSDGSLLQDAEDLLFSCNRWLVLSPHPDDELIGCGGTLLKAKARNKGVTVLQMTDGSATSALSGMPEHVRKTARLKEAAHIAAQLNCRLELFGEPDGALSVSDTTTGRLSKLLTELKPDLIFVPFVNDTHRDHVATNSLLSAVLERSSMKTTPRMASYEVWSLVPGNTISRIEDQVNEKCRLLREYRIPMLVKDYVLYSRSLNALHSLELTGTTGFAELFLVSEKEDYCNMVREFSGR